MDNQIEIINDLVKEITWEDCEPSIENFWKSLKSVDELFNLQVVIMLIESYFNFEENKNKSYRDLENEIRSHNLNLGLIANRVKTDKIVSELLEEGNTFVCKRKYFSKYQEESKNDNFDKKKYSSEFTVLYSCRPRDYVIEETLRHSRTMEENLDKLEESGFVITKDITKEREEKDFKRLSDQEISLANLIKEGKKLVVVKTVNPKDEYERCQKDNPDVEPSMIALGPTGAAVMALVKNGKLLSPMGFEIGISNYRTHKKYFKFRPIVNG